MKAFSLPTIALHIPIMTIHVAFAVAKHNFMNTHY